MGRIVGLVQWVHETHRKPRDARSPSKDRGQALREGNVIDGSGCGSRLQRFIGVPMEECIEARKPTPIETSSGQNSQAFGPAAERVGRCLDARHTALGIYARRMDWPTGASHDPATVRRGLSSGIRTAVAASVGLESADARATSPRTQRSGHCPLASRILAATKKRASSVKLAWFFSMKVGICCNPPGGACGPPQVTRRSSVSGTDVTALRRSPPSHALLGRCDWDFTTNFWITMRGPMISSGSSAKFMGICAVPSFWCGTVCLLTAPPLDDCLRMAPPGCRSNGFHTMPPTSILSRTSGISPNAEPWPTSFQKTFKTCTPNSRACWRPFDTSPIAYIRSLTQPT